MTDPMISDSASGLSYRVREPVSGPAGSCVVLLHGVGGDETNLARVGDAIAGDALVVLPRGPLTLGPGQFGWFRVAFTATGPVIEETEAESSRRTVIRLVEHLQSTHGISAGKTVIAGFSQGGIVSASVALTAPEKVKGFGILSGRILPELKPQLASKERLPHLRAFIGHGLQDNTLPVSWAQRSDQWLGELGVTHETRLYPGGHSIGPAMQADFVQWVRNSLA